MHDLEKLETLICAEIDKEVAKNSLTPDTVRTIGYAVDILKDIKTMRKDEMEMEEGYSGHYPGRGYNIMPYYAYDDGMDGRNYARRRDSMGRYSRGGSYARGDYSRDEKIDRLHRMMDEAESDAEREAYRKAIIQLENGKG